MKQMWYQSILIGTPETFEALSCYLISMKNFIEFFHIQQIMTKKLTKSK